MTDGNPVAPGSVLFEEGIRDWAEREGIRDWGLGIRRKTEETPEEEVALQPSEAETVIPAKAGIQRPALSGALSSQSLIPNPQSLSFPSPQPPHSRRGLDFRSPSQLEGGPRVELASRLRLDAQGALDRGTLIHAWFEQIEWLDDELPDDHVLLAVADRLELGSLDASALLSQFRASLARPAIAGLLSRGTYRQSAPAGVADPHWQVRREYPFVIREDEAILSGAIDRLVVLYDGPPAASKPVAAEVIDFKTDRVGPDDPPALAARVAHYRPQLEAYHRAAARLLGLVPGRVSARLAFVESGVVRAVCDAT